MGSRKYDKEFKLSAVELYKNGKSGTEICRDLGIPTSTFWGWLEDYNKHGDKSFPGSGNVNDVNEELQKLKKKLADAEIERDILKKALAIFSKTK